MTWVHGASGYRNYGCRCEICKAGWAERACSYRKRRLAAGCWRLLHGKFIHAYDRPAGSAL